MHYLIIPYLCKIAHRRTIGRAQVSRSLIENVNGSKVLAEMSNHTFEWRNTDLTNVLLAISNPDSDGPNGVRCGDTEFHQPFSGGSIKISEVVCVDVRAGGIVVHAVFGDDKTALDMSIKLARRKLDRKTLTAEDVLLVRTAASLSEQIEDCHLGPNDIIVEWSFNTHALLDMTNIKSFLKQTGYDSQTLLLSSGHALLRPTKKILGQAVKLKSWSLPILFRILFPQDPSVDQNHSAAVDVIQVAQNLRLMVELIKPPENRSLPQDLLQGLEYLLWIDDDCTQSNTLDHYFDLLEHELIVDAPTTLGEEQDGMDLDDERSDSERDDEKISNMELVSEDSGDDT